MHKHFVPMCVYTFFLEIEQSTFTSKNLCSVKCRYPVYRHSAIVIYCYIIKKSKLSGEINKNFNMCPDSEGQQFKQYTEEMACLYSMTDV